MATTAKLTVMDKTPREMGYSFPAEWERQEGTWFSWPRPEGISFPDKYHTVPKNLAAIIKAIVPRQRVHINVPNGNWEYIVRELLSKQRVPMGNVRFHHIPTNESWCRDHGPAFVRKSAVGSRQSAGRKKSLQARLAVVDWGFNAWGGKYPPYDADDAVPTRVAEQLRLPVWYPRIVMEGGAVDFNGRGTVLTTTDCLLNKNRNPGLTKEQIEGYLKDYYGQEHVCWLTGGIEGDDTDGHIDDLARFIAPGKIVFGVEENRRDRNYKVLRDVRKQLDELRDQEGRPFEIVEIPMPGRVEYDRQRLPATYINFLFINGALLVPTYRHANDRVALRILQKHLPKHKVIGIDCVELIWGLGAIHCLTQQQPAV
jgi:agmatine deiminase